MLRPIVVVLASWLFAVSAAAQTSQQTGELQLYIQQLEEQVRQLTGDNERLAYEVNQLRAQLGLAPAQTGAVTTQPLGQPADPALGAPPVDLGSISIDPNDPLISADGDPLLDTTAPAAYPQPPQVATPDPQLGGPIDLSVLAGADPLAPDDPHAGLTTPVDPNAGLGAPPAPGLPDSTQTAALPEEPAPTVSLSGSSRGEYDLAYGFVLTGDYGLAEESFRNWLASFPNDPQAADAQFWLGESLFQQGEYREAATHFLAVYNAGGESTKGPDALLKLGMSLAALGEQSTACGTFAEVSRRYPDASAALMNRVNEEAARAGC
jgi:tol-pal system protein YbgF